jgi:hypothetical protein
MLEAKDHIGEAVEKLYQLALSYDRGDVIGWDAIELATGFYRKTDREATLRGIIRKFKLRVLNEREIALWPVKGVGWKFLTRSEQVVHCARERQKRAGRQVHRGIKEVSAVDGASLSDYHRRLQNIQVQTMRSERARLRKSVREIKKTETNPRIQQKTA